MSYSYTIIPAPFEIGLSGLFNGATYAYSFGPKIAPFDPRKTTTSFSFTCLGKAFKIIISIWICFRLYISIKIRI